MKHLASIALTAALFFNVPALAQQTAVIQIDAEFGHPTSTSAQAIELGARLALRDIERAGLLKDIKLEIRTSDNRGISAIGVDNFLDATRDPSVIAVMAGKFSPVQIDVVPYAHSEKLILLNPWGSADGITDNGFRPNWVYRLSLKDDWASEAFIKAAKKRGKQKIGIILPNTAWGRSTQAALGNHARSANMRIIGERWYNWGETSLIQRYQDLIADGAELIVLVANEVEGSILVREVAKLSPDKTRPILSHWGVTGGNFEKLAPEAANIDFHVVQTFSFHKPQTDKAKAFLEDVLASTGKTKISEIDSPAGIVHAYDLTWLVAKALASTGRVDRTLLRDAMERLESHDGVVRRYERPFTPDRHDALSAQDVFFARYHAQSGLTPEE
jgi:branched-chain amino acid transport system substrate-binding protein